MSETQVSGKKFKLSDATHFVAWTSRAILFVCLVRLVGLPGFLHVGLLSLDPQTEPEVLESVLTRMLYCDMAAAVLLFGCLIGLVGGCIADDNIEPCCSDDKNWPDFLKIRRRNRWASCGVIVFLAVTLVWHFLGQSGVDFSTRSAGAMISEGIFGLALVGFLIRQIISARAIESS